MMITLVLHRCVVADRSRCDPHPHPVTPPHVPDALRQAYYHLVSYLPGPTLFSIMILLALPSGHIRSPHDVVVEFLVVSSAPLASLTQENCTLY